MRLLGGLSNTGRGGRRGPENLKKNLKQREGLAMPTSHHDLTRVWLTESYHMNAIAHISVSAELP